MDCEKRYSIIDEISPLQAKAWDAENQALLLDKEGNSVWAAYQRENAIALRTQDTEERIMLIFDRCDKGNAILDSIIAAKEQGYDIPIITAITPGVDYTLMQQ